MPVVSSHTDLTFPPNALIMFLNGADERKAYAGNLARQGGDSGPTGTCRDGEVRNGFLAKYSL